VKTHNRNTDDSSVPHKVLYISLDGMTDPLGQSQVLPYLKELSQKGFQITLLSLEKKERFRAHKSLIQSICQEANINWQPIFYSQAIPILSSVYNVFKLKQKAFSLQKQIGFSIVHCRNYVCSIVGLKLKQQFGVKFICDTRGFWHEERLSGFRDKFLVSTIFNYFVQKEKEFFAQADCIVTLNQTAKEEIEQRLEFDKSKTTIEFIPCCVDYELFTPLSIEQKKSLRKSLNIEIEDVVLGYVGSIGTIYMLDEMLDFFAVILKKVKKAKFFIITLEPPQTIFQKAQQRDIPLETLIIKAATRKEVSLYLNTVDIAISFIKPIYEKRGCSPTKMGEYWAMNIPVIANDGVGDVGKIMRDTEGGALVTEFSGKAYLEALEKILQLKKHNFSIRDTSKTYYNLTQGVEKYHKIYTRLAQI
jgi:glycosyltransferase involved in cell wall biosynthesis